MEYKIKKFISFLSDEEIDEQLEDIFEWAKIYKNLLEEEKQKRQSVSFKGCDSGQFEPIGFGGDFLETSEKEYFEPQDEEEYLQTETIGFNVAQMINEKISMLSIDETKERIEKLELISQEYLSDDEKVQLSYEIEVCELHILELGGSNVDEMFCPYCGELLDDNAKFCSKCGKKV